MGIINHHLYADCLPKLCIVEIGNDLTLPALVASPRFCLLAGILFFFMIFITISILILKEHRNKIIFFLSFVSFFVFLSFCLFPVLLGGFLDYSQNWKA